MVVHPDIKLFFSFFFLPIVISKTACNAFISTEMLVRRSNVFKWLDCHPYSPNIPSLVLLVCSQSQCAALH